MVFATISWAGARLGTDDATQLDLLQQFGYNIGIREAIRADCRDLNSRKHKKGDLSAGIYTLPMIYAISMTDHPCHPTLLARLENRPFSGEDVAELVALLIDMGALDWSMSVAQTYHEQAVAKLKLLPADCAEGLRIYVS
jgi:geranylgeranyl pyrophosphate synthase